MASACPVGNYEVSVQVADDGGTALDTFNIEVKPLPSPSLGADQTVCENSTVTLSVSSGTTGLSAYQWKLDGSDIAGATSPTYTFTATSLTAGTYTVQVDSNGCTGVSAPVEITVNPKPVAVVTGDNEVCLNGTVTLSGSSSTGSGTLTYTWYEGGTTSADSVGEGVSYTTDPITTSTDYYLKVTDNGCDSIVKYTVSPYSPITPPTLSATGDLTTICEGTSTTIGASPTSYSTYAWLNENKTVISSGTMTVADFTTPNLTGDTTFYLAVSDANGCRDTASITISTNSTPSVSITPTGSTTRLRTIYRCEF